MQSYGWRIRPKRHSSSFNSRPAGGTDPLPDLIVTDLNLPGISGVELIRALKSDHRFRCIPCIVLSSSSDARDIEAAYDAFASGYLTKPDSIEDYAVMIASLSAYWFTLM